jgi:hypothetical protein
VIVLVGCDVSGSDMPFECGSQCLATSRRNTSSSTSLDADRRPSNNSRFTSWKKIRYSRRNDTVRDHALPPRTPITQVKGTGADFWNPTG